MTSASGCLPSYISCRSYYYEPDEEIHNFPFFFAKIRYPYELYKGKSLFLRGFFLKGTAGLTAGCP